MKLSLRLREITNMVEAGSQIADIGTDHGYVPVSLALTGQIKKAIAMDLRKGPLLRAEAHVAEYGLEGMIELRLSDGLEKLTVKEADTIIIAGMGGPLIVRILKARPDILQDAAHFILSPQSEPEAVRSFLQSAGLNIIAERMVFEDGKYYVIMKTAKGLMNYERYIDFRFGKRLLEAKDAVLQQFLDKEEASLQRLLTSLQGADSEKAVTRRKELNDELAAIKEAKDAML